MLDSFVYVPALSVCAVYAWPLSSTMIESQQSSARAETSNAAAASTRVAQFAQLRSVHYSY